MDSRPWIGVKSRDHLNYLHKFSPVLTGLQQTMTKQSEMEATSCVLKYEHTSCGILRTADRSSDASYAIIRKH